MVNGYRKLQSIFIRGLKCSCYDDLNKTWLFIKNLIKNDNNYECYDNYCCITCMSSTFTIFLSVLNIQNLSCLCLILFYKYLCSFLVYFFLPRSLHFKIDYPYFLQEFHLGILKWLGIIRLLSDILIHRTNYLYTFLTLCEYFIHLNKFNIRLHYKFEVTN